MSMKPQFQIDTVAVRFTDLEELPRILQEYRGRGYQLWGAKAQPGDDSACVVFSKVNPL
jgi:hypothetical protein